MIEVLIATLLLAVNVVVWVGVAHFIVCLVDEMRRNR